MTVSSRRAKQRRVEEDVPPVAICKRHASGVLAARLPPHRLRDVASPESLSFSFFLSRRFLFLFSLKLIFETRERREGAARIVALDGERERNREIPIVREAMRELSAVSANPAG